ncbi:lytic transglycosylase domain-containing protein [Nocardioides sp. Bht2]|uniref:aggregation-promoting factor C-terminal-like domain-containing protein n=1 Tax=Nocardioides sp. Bht2 TaxID=3392297 RepID=UPI0039B3C8F2
MSKHKKYVPTHRAPVASAPKRVVRNTLVFSTIAVAATGTAVAAGVAGDSPASGNFDNVSANLSAGVAASTGEAPDAAAIAERRTEQVSRSDRRDQVPAATEAALLSAQPKGNAITRTEDHSDADPKEVAKVLLAEFGFDAGQFGCLDSLWTRESNWRVNADNPTSSAYGIPQALPGSKMASAGADWATNPVTQIRWGLGYIEDRYGSPCSAWGHSQARGWY